jgi:cell division protein FtsW (lipid II flippase)
MLLFSGFTFVEFIMCLSLSVVVVVIIIIFIMLFSSQPKRLFVWRSKSTRPKSIEEWWWWGNYQS